METIESAEVAELPNILVLGLFLMFMGLLVEGVWYDQWYDTKSTGGRFQRQESAFRRWLGTPEFPAKCGRYHLYVSLACPWAHRTLIFRQLKALQGCIDVSVVHPLLQPQAAQPNAHRSRRSSQQLTMGQCHCNVISCSRLAIG